MKSFTVAAVQMNAAKDDLEQNLSVHVRFIREAAVQGCHLVVFPELSASAHYGGEDVVRFAEEAGRGRIWEVLAEQARQHQLIVGYGFCEIAHGTYYNSYALVGPQGPIGVQRKVHASGDEYFRFRMGRSLAVFDVGLCRVGVLVCYDCCFCEAWRILALQGAEVILLPHAARSGAGKRVPRGRQLEALRSFLAGLPGDNGTYAKANAAFVVFGNQVDYNGHSTHSGGAYVLDPFGTVLARSHASLCDQMVAARLNAADLDRARRSSHCTLKTRRPELYAELVRMV
jgi:predicted amidohydrolase